MAEELTMTPAFTDVCNDLLTFEYETGKLALERGQKQTSDKLASDMRLGRPTGLERDKLTDEGRELAQPKLAILGSDSHSSHRGRATCNQRRVRKPRRTELVCMAKKSQRKTSLPTKTVS